MRIKLIIFIIIAFFVVSLGSLVWAEGPAVGVPGVMVSPQQEQEQVQSNESQKTAEGTTAGTDQEVKAKKYGITFPVSELGNCNSLSECKTYCDDPVNKDACAAFAKQKGLYKEQTKGNDVINKAKLELGCTSAESCKALCSLEVNHDKCASFAKKNKIETSQQSPKPTDNKTLEKAKEILGCSSVTECKSFCSQEQNHEKCSDFAKQAGLKGGDRKVGPGGCTSEQTCTQYCTDPDHFQECSKFGKSSTQGKLSSSGTNSASGFKGPGGCASETECRAYCEKNPTECANYKARIQQINSGQPQTGVQTQQSSTPMDKETYCRMYPDHCPQPPLSGAPLPSRTVFPSGQPLPTGITKEEYCRIYPDHCPSPYPSGSTYYQPSPGSSTYPSGYPTTTNTTGVKKSRNSLICLKRILRNLVER